MFDAHAQREVLAFDPHPLRVQAARKMSRAECPVASTTASAR
jgi:hypothetical protein